MNKPKIGLFEAGFYAPDFIAAHGAPGDWFKRFLGRASNDGFDFEVYLAIEGELPDAIDACDGYLITGSPASVIDREPWMLALADFCLRAMGTKPVIGICFGHQLLCQALGGEVRAADVGWGIGVHRYTVNGADDWMTPPLGEVAMLTSHMDQVTRLPPGAEVLASSAFCPNAILRLGPNAISIQAHPEATRDCFGSVYEMRRERYAPGQADRALASFEQTTDEERVGRWLVKFLNDRISLGDT